MKKLFYIGLIGLVLFEIMKVYFVMPMPGSQQLNTVDLAYFLHSYRWFFRIGFGVMVAAGIFTVFSTEKRLLPSLAILLAFVIVYIFNFRMTADQMFRQPGKLVFKPRKENTLNDSSLVVAVTHNMEARAYPVRYIQYHHQVRDTISGRPIMVTYCNVCRTGRVFEPVVDGKTESFRLVGMDHFNAMFEDETTKSWWRQATGEAITGPLKGKRLIEVESNQYTLNKFFSLHPFGQVMQAEMASKENYDSLGNFEKGKSKGRLTRTDSLSWKDKSWILGVNIAGNAKAYDWNEIKKLKALNDRIGDTPVLIVIASDQQSFAAFKTNGNHDFTVRNDSIIGSNKSYDLLGRSSDGTKLEPVKIYQEFWHSWKQFHPDTEVYSTSLNGN